MSGINHELCRANVVNMVLPVCEFCLTVRPIVEVSWVCFNRFCETSSNASTRTFSGSIPSNLTSNCISRAFDRDNNSLP